MVKRWSLAVVALVMVLGAGVGAVALATSDDGETGRTVSIGAIQLAAENTQASESMQFELRSSGSLGVSASGVVSGDGRHGTVSVDLGSLGSIEERIVDGTVYVGGGDLLDRFLGGRTGSWITITPGDLQAALGSSGLGDLGQGPTSALDLLDDVAGPVETVGTDTVAGRPATHYRVSIDTDGTSTVDVWIDDGDRVVKVKAASPEGGDLTFEVTAFGVPVDVQAPPADEVIQLPDVLGSLGKGVIR